MVFSAAGVNMEVSRFFLEDFQQGGAMRNLSFSSIWRAIRLLSPSSRRSWISLSRSISRTPAGSTALSFSLA
jgi:hypothetical protein